MSRMPRMIGYCLMGLTLAAAVGGKQGWFGGIGPVPAAAVAIILGALGVMLVMTDLMVRGLYAQADAMARAEAAEAERAGDGADGDDSREKDIVA